ncbi:hypothetical protein KKI24_27255 [bacterium]|nr:hypothetical protein [bacterium]
MSEEKRFKTGLSGDSKLGQGFPETQEEFPILSGLEEIPDELKSMPYFEDCKFGLDNPGPADEFPILFGIEKVSGLTS